MALTVVLPGVHEGLVPATHRAVFYVATATDEGNRTAVAGDRGRAMEVPIGVELILEGGDIYADLAIYSQSEALPRYRQAIALLEAPALDSGQRMRRIDITLKWAALVLISAELIDALGTAVEDARGLEDRERLMSAMHFFGMMN